MSIGTNPERLTQNNELLTDNLNELTNLKTIINALPQVLNTSDATALENDIAFGKTAYVNGKKIEGSIDTLDATQGIATRGIFRNNVTDGNVYLDYTFINDKLFRSTSEHTLYISEADLATALNLSADKIAVGNTILGIEGTSSGLDTSDANASELNLEQGFDAYVNGKKISGSLPMACGNNDIALKNNDIILNMNNDTQQVNITTTVQGLNGIADSKFIIDCNYTNAEGFINPIKATQQVDMSILAAQIGLLPGMLVEGNTILGMAGTATELDIAATEIWNTTNNPIVADITELEVYEDTGIVGFKADIPASVTNKPQLLITGTGLIELQSKVYETGCLCTRLNTLEQLETYAGEDDEIVTVITSEGEYLGTFKYQDNKATEIVSASAYEKTLTVSEYDSAVDTTEAILGEEVN